ncbi:ML domain-containing protein [Actinomadura harenae]|uniref:MD-2-related lipid-recognition domain-containing protein n=1 Tax=Actinomadura harenae TaxID=2483351 RepID=A0A3M2LPI1_9ACTN|nr:ML domain-containing protein [Actinomadura harenae]RMI38996.1 hypothetical protein EBO15_31020 [Actinomadura harenae]
MTGWNYVDCGLPSDPLQIESIVFDPDPPRPGAPLKVAIKAVATDRIVDGAVVDLTVKLGLIKLLAKRHDLLAMLRGDTTDGFTLTCDTFRGGDAIERGPLQLTLSWDPLPKETPRAKFNISVRCFTNDEDDLASLDFKVDFQPHPA